MIEKATTRICLGNEDRRWGYPALQVGWRREEDGLGYLGTGVVWATEDDRLEGEWSVNIRQGNPLGTVHIFINMLSHGALCSDSIYGAGITERDLQWATCYLAAVIKGKDIWRQR